MREGALSLGGGKQRALLALLLIHPNESLSTDRLIDELWGEQPPATAAKILQNYVSQLRRALGDDRLQTQARGYALRVGRASSTSTASGSCSRRGEGRRPPATLSGRRCCCATRSRCGAARRWPTSPMSRSPATRSVGSRSFA